MAKRQIKKWAFTPGNSGVAKIVIPGHYSQETLLLITNVTRGVILYNFADTANTPVTVSFKPGYVPTSATSGSVVTYGKDVFGANGTAAIQSTVSGVGETTIVFNSALAVGGSSTDQISVLVEEKFQYVRPWGDFGTDAIERQRTANPQALIDADFEYGLQNTKWQGYEYVGKVPSIYEQVSADLNVAMVTASTNTISSLVTMQVANHGLTAGSPVTVQGLDQTIIGYPRAQGSFLVFSANTNFFSYYAKGNVGISANTRMDTIRTQVRKGGLYSGSSLPLSYIDSDKQSPQSKIVLTFATPHGFTPGYPLIINANPNWGANTSLSNLPGAYFANVINDPYRVTIYARGQVNPTSSAPNPSSVWGAGGANIGNVFVSTTSQVAVYARPDGFFTHRPGDGGVIFGVGSPIHGATTIRQSKKYFRYQSGKGLLYTTGVMFAPNFDIVAATTDGGNITSTAIIRVVTGVPHGLQIGAGIRLRGVATTGYDDYYTVLTVEDDVTVRVACTNGVGVGSSTAAMTGLPKLFVTNWHGACVRTGPHDDANGMFFEYDGQNFNVCKRTSTSQMAGVASFVPNSNYVNGTGSLYTQQLKVGDKVILKGMIHRVSYVFSDTQISVSPDFRGNVAVNNNYIWRVDEQRTQQKDFNMDTVDGSGSMNNPSGYKMDPNHMQMVGIQFTWYGAGFMDFMVRGNDANFIMLHRFKQNNINPTASMRSANLPVRYEVSNEAANGVTSISPLSGGITPSDTTIPVSDLTFYPSSGFVYIDNELIQYTGVNAGTNPPTLTGCVRGAVGNVYVSGSYRQFQGANVAAHNINTGVELVSCTSTVNLSHWGSSYIMDGGFDFDRGYSFDYSTVNGLTISANTTSVFGIRLSPSASNGQPGDLGAKDLLNKAQLLLNNLVLNVPTTVTGAGQPAANVSVLIQGIANPSNYYQGESWTNLNSLSGNQPSLTQIATGPSFQANVNGIAADGVTQIPGSVPGTITPGQFAQGGEKLFEFVCTPGQKSDFDLAGVKELTQSALGGVGTFPNGSDTVYINMSLIPYTTPLTTTLTNVVVTMRWGEAQA